MRLNKIFKSFVIASLIFNSTVQANTVISYDEIKDDLAYLNKNITISPTQTDTSKDITFKNNKMCKTKDFMHFLSDDDSLYWDGKCKDGYPLGLGRVYIRSHNGYEYTKNVDILANYI